MDHFPHAILSLKKISEKKREKLSPLSTQQPPEKKKRRWSDAAAGRFPAAAPPRRSAKLIFFKIFFISISSSPSPLLISGLSFHKTVTVWPRSSFKVSTFLSVKRERNEKKESVTF